MINRVKYYRLLNGLSQLELSKKVGVSRNTISNIERGFYQPSYILAVKISSFFGQFVEHIFVLEDCDYE